MGGYRSGAEANGYLKAKPPSIGVRTFGSQSPQPGGLGTELQAVGDFFDF